MSKVLRALVIDDGNQLAHQLRQLISPAFEEATFQIIYTAHEAFEALMGDDYNVCLIPEKMSEADVTSLISDYKKLEKDIECDFIQVRAFISPDFKREILRARGFATVISAEVSPADMQAINDTLKGQVRSQQILVKIKNIEESIALVLKNLDYVASDRKRGRQTPLGSISSEFINTEAAFDEKILKKYFNSLAAEAETVTAPVASKLEVPQAVLKKRAPHMSEDGYSGVSRRVWDRLLKLYGNINQPKQTAEGTEAQAAEAPDESAALADPVAEVETLLDKGTK